MDYIGGFDIFNDLFVFSEVALADAAIAEDPDVADLREEYLMARKALECEHALNLLLLSRLFLPEPPADDCSSSEVLSDDDESCTTGSHLPPPHPASDCGIPRLWRRPPVEFPYFQSVSIIFNPILRNAHNKLAEARNIFIENHISVTTYATTYAGHERLKAIGAVDRTILVLGGLGTLREVLNGVMERPDHKLVQLGYLPNGSLCTSHSLSDGIRHVLQGEVREMDVLLVESVTPEASLLTRHPLARVTEEAAQRPGAPVRDKCYCMSTGGWGAIASVMKRYQKRWKFLRHRTGFQIAGLAQLARNRQYRARLDFPEGELPDELRALYARPNDYSGVNFFNCRSLSKMLVAPRGQLDDGLMDVHLVWAGSRKQMRRAMNIKSYGKSKYLDGTKPCPSKSRPMNLDYIQVSSMIVWPCSSSDSPQDDFEPESVHVDGDVSFGSPFRVTVLPRAIRIFASENWSL